MSHTPGPWRWKLEEFGSYRLIAKDGTKVADDGSADGEYGGWMNDPKEPNARLIAAAPDLLEALELAHAMLSGANMNVNVVEKKVRAAIAKARGEK